METRCQKCGGPVGGDQAFCPNCGAVVGMADAGAARDEDELQSTMIGREKPSASPRPVTAPRAAYAPRAAEAGGAPAPAARRGGNTALVAAIGLVAVLLIGGLLLLLYYLNSQG